MYLYSQPELLTPENHGSLGLLRSEGPFGFAKAVRVIPIAVSETNSAEKHYPVVFSDNDEPAMLAVLGIEDINLFVDVNGNWEVNRYVPAYFRCHPFALASSADDRLAVVIDRASESISDKPDIPFYDGDKLSPQIQERVDFCVQFTAHRKQTQIFCDRIKELDLLVPQQITRRTKGETRERSLASFAAVDPEKLKELDADVVKELNDNGMLAAIHAHLSSMENWHYLIARHDTRHDSGEDGTA